MHFFLSLLFLDCPNDCGLKICSAPSECQTLPKQLHDAQECNIVKKVGDKSPEKWLMVLRVLVKRKTVPDQWNKFLLLEDHLEARMDFSIMKGSVRPTSVSADFYEIYKIKGFKVRPNFYSARPSGSHCMYARTWIVVLLAS